MTDKTKPLRRWTGPSGKEYEEWLGCHGCVGCVMQDPRNESGAEDCFDADCRLTIFRLPGDPPSWAKEQK